MRSRPCPHPRNLQRTKVTLNHHEIPLLVCLFKMLFLGYSAYKREDSAKEFLNQSSGKRPTNEILFFPSKRKDGILFVLLEILLPIFDKFIQYYFIIVNKAITVFVQTTTFLNLSRRKTYILPILVLKAPQL